MLWLVAILGLALLMVVHEGGHHLVARAFGMRVIKFSIGFGPALWRHQPRGSETVYQIALIPFLAYVQIAGMNPFEEVDPDDRSSYANASLPARISTIFAGPMANYLFASVLFFGAFIAGGEEVSTTQVKVIERGPAQAGQMKDGDRILSIQGTRIENWDQLRKIVNENPGKRLEFEVERGGRRLKLGVVPEKRNSGGVIGVQSIPKLVPMSTGDAAVRSVKAPALFVAGLVMHLGRVVTGRESAELTGPIGIVSETRKAIEKSLASYLWVLAAISTALAVFNLLPFPALDGGRLIFLGYEAIARRRPNPRVEAHIHAFGVVMLLAVMIAVFVRDIRVYVGGGSPASSAEPSASSSASARPAK